MKEILDMFEKQLSLIKCAKEELFPPATDEEINQAEKALGIQFPQDMRILYKWHNRQKGIYFLFGEFRLFSLEEVLKMKNANLEFLTDEYTNVTNDEGVFKNCIANHQWIPIGDNGGNTILYLDMDPGKQGVFGQLIEACDGEPECKFSGINEFLQNIIHNIESGKVIWSQEAGSFWPVQD